MVLSIEKLELSVIKRKTVSKGEPDGWKTICVFWYIKSHMPEFLNL